MLTLGRVGPGRAVGVAVLTVLTMSALMACTPRADAPRETAIQRLQAQCEQAMVRQTCRVMQGTAAAAAAPGSVVFVAGVGAVDAAAYAQLRSDGESMCTQAASACRADWQGSACRSWRALSVDSASGSAVGSGPAAAL